MYDQSLSDWTDAIVRVVYSPNKEHRMVLLKSENGYYRYVTEHLGRWSDDEWVELAGHSDVLPAVWRCQEAGCSFFGTETEAWRDFASSPAYSTFFQ